MRKRAVAVAVFATLVVGTAAVPAQAKCGTRCLNGKVNTLQNQVLTMENQIRSLIGQVGTLQGAVQTGQRALSAFVSCLRETPITQYGDPAGSFGYAYDIGGASYVNTTALDVTATNDLVGAWFLSDACNGQTIGAARIQRAVLAPVARHGGR